VRSGVQKKKSASHGHTNRTLSGLHVVGWGGTPTEKKKKGRTKEGVWGRK